MGASARGSKSKAARAALIAEVAAVLERKDRGADLRVSVLVKQYEVDRRLRCRPRSIEDAMRGLNELVPALKAVRVRDITKAGVTAWQAEQVAKGRAHKTINNRVMALQAMLNLAVELGQLERNPLKGLRALPNTLIHRRRMPRALTNEEVDRMLVAAGEVDAAKARRVHGQSKRVRFPQRPLLIFLLGTGTRFGEACALRWGDVNLETGSVTLRGETTKTQTTRTIPLHPSVVDEMRAHLAWSTEFFPTPPTDSTPVFCTPMGIAVPGQNKVFGRWLDDVFRAAGIPKRDASGRVVHVHAMRHTFATRLARAGIGVATAQKLTGHKTTAVLLGVYTHVSQEDARVAINALPSVHPTKSPVVHP